MHAEEPTQGGVEAKATPAPAVSNPSFVPMDSSTPDGMDAVLDYTLMLAIAQARAAHRSGPWHGMAWHCRSVDAIGMSRTSRALYLTQVPESELPCQFEKFYSSHLLPLRPSGVTVDVKRSGYKKLAKLFSVWEKKGALTTKAVHKQDCIVALNRQHKVRPPAGTSPPYMPSSCTAASCDATQNPTGRDFGGRGLRRGAYSGTDTWGGGGGGGADSRDRGWQRNNNSRGHVPSAFLHSTPSG